MWSRTRRPVEEIHDRSRQILDPGSPSIRYTRLQSRDDFGYEYFGRVDLTQGYTPNSTRLLSTQTDSGYSSYFKGHYWDTSFSTLADLDFDFGLDVVLGGRYDRMSVTSTAVLAQDGRASSA
jgi:iron complex outermembrane receptor protein